MVSGRDGRPQLCFRAGPGSGRGPLRIWAQSTVFDLTIDMSIDEDDAMSRTFRLQILLTICFLAALLLAPAVLAQPDECKGEAVAIVQVTINEENAISVDKESVTIERQGRVCWEVSGLSEGETLAMSGKEEGDDHFPETTVSLPRSFMNSGVANKPGTFRYDLILSDGEGEVSRLDPEVIVDPGP